MYYYVYTASRLEVNNMLKKLNIEYETKQKGQSFNTNNSYDDISSHKWHATKTKILKDHLLSDKNLTLNVSGHSVWIDEIEHDDNRYKNCIKCNERFDTFNKKFMKKCYTCYKGIN